MEAIDEVRSNGTSLMPEGFELKLDSQAMADLLEFLRQPRGDSLRETR